MNKSTIGEYRLYWGESHDNTYQFASMSTPVEEVLERAASHLDFYAAAYYTACAAAFEEGGHQAEKSGASRIILEGWKDPQRLEREWAEVQRATAAANRPGEFITLPGYEWQGDGSSGDHNVYFLREGAKIHRVATLKELYACLKGTDALAIPHHTGYRPGRRGRDWSVWDEAMSPFTEIYSVHGCSETDEEWIGLRKNFYMGPGQGGGTYQDALDRGYHLGAICSTDNWGDMPGHYGNGRMACLAEELTREALWKAFKARRVYGVTGDRIRIDFRVDGAVMGSVISASGPRRVRVDVVGSDALDRIELLRNGRVIATHCHQGTWEVPPSGRRARFKLRIEAGWGPRPGELDLPDRVWNGRLTVDGAALLDCEPCWISSGQGCPVLAGGTASFRLVSSSRNVAEPRHNANVFELEADPGSAAVLELNGLTLREPLARLAAGSRVLWYRDDCIRALEENAGVPAGSPEREDVYYLMAYKAKVHRLIPEAGYTARLDFEDDEPLGGETHYRVRVEQRNGQRAWSSPIWATPDL
ncbi:MAG: DUF3604 domain-containing protein [Spirochaetales bacterium]|nr:DUF3604 domain-containing protein [Spirochaetales bacterium]